MPALPWYRRVGIRKVVIFGTMFVTNLLVSSSLLWFGKIDGDGWIAYNKSSTYLIGLTFGGANAAEHISKLVTGLKK